MSRFKQNIMYFVIIVVVFILCFFTMRPSNNMVTKGVFLPSYSFKIPATDPDNIKTYNLRYRSDMDNNIGAVRASTHVTNSSEYDFACEQDIKKAKVLAAQNGATEIKFVCLYPEGQLNELSNVSLQGYAFKD